jgi:hypothetical protein
MTDLQQIVVGIVYQNQNHVSPMICICLSVSRMLQLTLKNDFSVFCLSLLAADSMKPNKLNRHFKTKHSEMKNKPEEYFHRKLVEICIQQRSFVNTTTMSSKALLASYQVSCRVAQNKEPQMIAETVISSQHSEDHD